MYCKRRFDFHLFCTYSNINIGSVVVTTAYDETAAFSYVQFRFQFLTRKLLLDTRLAAVSYAGHYQEYHNLNEILLLARAKLFR